MLPLNHRAANDRSPPNVSNVVMPIWRSSVGARHALVNVWSTRECDSANISIRCRPSKSGHSRRKLCAFKGLSSKSLKRKSIEIRRSAAHNLKVVGSNPTPATKIPKQYKILADGIVLPQALRTFTSTTHQHINTSTHQESIGGLGLAPVSSDTQAVAF